MAHVPMPVGRPRRVTPLPRRLPRSHPPGRRRAAPASVALRRPPHRNSSAGRQVGGVATADALVPPPRHRPDASAARPSTAPICIICSPLLAAGGWRSVFLLWRRLGVPNVLLYTLWASNALFGSDAPRYAPLFRGAIYVFLRSAILKSTNGPAP